jgi:hypothetical protein
MGVRGRLRLHKGFSPENSWEWNDVVVEGGVIWEHLSCRVAALLGFLGVLNDTCEIRWCGSPQALISSSQLPAWRP